ncbi:MAG: hypothetical protein ACREOJ_12530 [Gemmatimonadaceae bacterium]
MRHPIRSALCKTAAVLSVVCASPASGHAQNSSVPGDLMTAILIPSLKYRDLVGFRDVKAADITLVGVKQAMAAATAGAPMLRSQMQQSYEQSLKDEAAAIDSLRRNLSSTQWCQSGKCSPAPNNQLVRDALAKAHVAMTRVVALDPLRDGRVVVFYQE